MRLCSFIITGYNTPHFLLMTLDFRSSRGADYYPEAINICAWIAEISHPHDQPLSSFLVFCCCCFFLFLFFPLSHCVKLWSFLLRPSPFEGLLALCPRLSHSWLLSFHPHSRFPRSAPVSSELDR